MIAELMKHLAYKCAPVEAEIERLAAYQTIFSSQVALAAEGRRASALDVLCISQSQHLLARLNKNLTVSFCTYRRTCNKRCVTCSSMLIQLRKVDGSSRSMLTSDLTRYNP